MFSNISKLKVGGLLSGMVISATKLSVEKDKKRSERLIEETWWKKKAFQELTHPVKDYVSER